MTRLLTPSLLAALVALAGAGSVRAAPRAETFPLGVSASTGAVCEAVRDYDDPLSVHGGKAWSVRCRGFDVPLGRLFAATSAEGWTAALAGRAQCDAGKPAALPGLPDASRASCKEIKTGVPYLAYHAGSGRRMVAAEGFGQIADVLETGLRVVADAAPPPGAGQKQTSTAQTEIAAAFGGALPGLAQSADAAAASPQRLRQRGYLLNNEWQFGGAENDFRALTSQAQERNASAHEQAEALLNLALNVSNNGRFSEADQLFAKAEPLTAQANDKVLTARAMNYRALHLRNQGRFAEAIAAAEQALAARAQMRAEMGAGPAAASDNGAVVIGPDLARALNTLPDRKDAMGTKMPTVAEQLELQDAQAYHAIGSAKAAMGDSAGAREAFERAAGILGTYASPGSVVVWLRARVQDDLAALDLAGGDAAGAAVRLRGGIAILRTRHAGSLAEGAMLFDLGRAEAAAGQRDAALADYAQAFAVFRDQRGSLGASAQAASTYFDLLLDAAKADPAKAGEYAETFFSASQVVVSDATAETVARLAARVASGDSATTGLARGLEDSQRSLRATEGEIARAQAAGTYTGADKERLDAALKTANEQVGVLEQQLLAADPRYGQLVSSEATLAQMEQHLRPDEVYAKVFLVGDSAYGLLISKTGAQPYKIGLGRDALEAAATKLRAPFDAVDSLPAYDVGAAHEMFETLFGPVEANVLAARHLIYEPSGTLIAVPAAVLVTDPASADLVKSHRQPGKMDDYRGVAWLGARMDSSLAVSAASFIQSRDFRPSAAAQPYLGFGNPALAQASGDPRAFDSVTKRGLGDLLVGGDVCGKVREALLRLDPLPETAEEVQVVGQSLGAGAGSVVTGSAFTDGDIKTRTDLGTFKVLYFATHGILPNANACLPEPALVTSLGAGDSDALLETSEILNLKLDADLVVLAACDTGGAGASTDETGLQGGGEALGGLARAFIYAGARGLIVSHWSVDSSSSEKLMTGLFRSGAATEAEGLAQAQATLMADPMTSHPYFWAPFTLVGDGGRPLPGR